MSQSDRDLLFAEKEKTIFNRLFRGKRGRAVGRPLYNALTGLEIFIQHTADRLLPQKKMDQTLVNTHLTALIKTFERPAALSRLLASIRRFYPHMPIIVVDDSREPQFHDGVQTITMSFNSGLSTGRNEGLRHVTTPFVLLLDDDFIFYRHTHLPAALTLMESEPRIDIMSGEVVNLPQYYVTDYSKITTFPTEAQSVTPPGSSLAGLPVYDVVPNFFIARSEGLRRVLWDERLMHYEHKDFFTRAKGVLTSVYNKNLRCLHVRTMFDEQYLSYRLDVADSQEHILTQYYGFSRPQAQEQNREDDPA